MSKPNFFKLDKNTVDIYFADTRKVENLLPCHRDFLTRNEICNLDKIKSKNAHLNFRVSRYLVKSVFSLQTGIDLLSFEILKDEFGKPYLSLPDHFKNIKFSLSHSRGMVACCFTHTFNVGIDVEYMNRDIVDTGKAFFTREEVEFLSCFSEAENRMTYLIWTMKEAHIKAKGLGMANMPMDSFSVLDKAQMHYETYSIKKDYFLSVAIENYQNQKFRIREVVV